MFEPLNSSCIVVSVFHPCIVNNFEYRFKKYGHFSYQIRSVPVGGLYISRRQLSKHFVVSRNKSSIESTVWISTLNTTRLSFGFTGASGAASVSVTV